MRAYELLNETLTPQQNTELQKAIYKIFDSVGVELQGSGLEPVTQHFIKRLNSPATRVGTKSNGLTLIGLIDIFSTLASEPDFIKVLNKLKSKTISRSLHQGECLIRFKINGKPTDIMVYYTPSKNAFKFGTAVVGGQYKMGDKEYYPENTYDLHVDIPVNNTVDKDFESRAAAFNSFIVHVPIARVIYDYIANIGEQASMIAKDNKVGASNDSVKGIIDKLHTAIKILVDNKLLSPATQEKLQHQFSPTNQPNNKNILSIYTKTKPQHIDKTISNVVSSINKDLADQFINNQYNRFRIAQSFFYSKLLDKTNNIEDINDVNKLIEYLQKESSLFNTQGFFADTNMDDLVDSIIKNENLNSTEIQSVREYNKRLTNTYNMLRNLENSKPSGVNTNRSTLDNNIFKRQEASFKFYSYLEKLKNTTLLTLLHNFINTGNKTLITSLQREIDDAVRRLQSQKYYVSANELVKNFQAFLQSISNMQLAEESTLLGSKPKKNPKYLGATEKVANISPVLGSKPKKQKALMNKFFGSS